MGSTQKYSLKWNDFTVNVASTFRDLHSRHDFADVTLACSDGSTLEAHKVILSSVSSYFRDILKTTPCKHPIIILKDTGRDEASAMLEFAYTGEVNVAQELLSSLLHTARSFRIKGLDKVENPVDPPPRPDANTPTSEHWMESANHTRSHTPSSIQSQHDIKPPLQFPTEPLLASEVMGVKGASPPSSHPPRSGSSFNGLLRSAERERERELQNHMSPPPSLPNSQPPTREASPAPLGAAANARTPPPKRWKRSFDMAHPSSIRKETVSADQPLSLIAEDYSHSRDSSVHEPPPAKRFCDQNRTITSSGAAENNGQRSLPYPHSMPTSPTMFDRGNEARLAGFIRHHLAANNESNGIRNSTPVGTPERALALVNGGGRKSSTASNQQATSSSDANGPLDFRCFSAPKQEAAGATSEYSGQQNGVRHVSDEESGDRYRMSSLVFRPESAPTVLDMSPECSLSGPPSVRDDAHPDDDKHMLHGEDLNDSVAKAFSIAPDGMGRYTCDECGKIFKHPGSLQHHRHIHRGTHRCPSCGKAFSRRWDMERHLNKSKYGCPANRFSIGSTGSNNSNGSSGSGGPGAGAATAVPISGAAMAIAAAAVASAAANGTSGVTICPQIPNGTAAAAAASLTASSPTLHNTTA